MPTLSGVLPFSISPINNIQPFTYRDGTTHLQLLEKLRVYINDVLRVEFNDEMDRLYTAILDGIANATGTVNQAVDSFDEIHATFVANVNALVAAINDRVGPPSTVFATLSAPYTVTVDPTWPNSHPVRFELTQDATGGRIISLAGIAGYVATNIIPGGVTEFTITKDSAGVWRAVQDFTKESVIHVEKYGAKGDAGITDNAPAFAAAYTRFLQTGQPIVLGSGEYWTSQPWNVYRPNNPAKPLLIMGQSQNATKVIANFFGAGLALINAHDPAGLARASSTSITDIQFGNVSTTLGANPVAVDIFGMGESRMERVRFGPSNNTHMSLASMQNVRMRDIVSFYGGKTFNYRDTTGITFSTEVGSSTLTASAAIFNGADVGRTINIYGTTDRVKYTITQYNSPTNVSISGTTPAITLTNVPGYFETARVSTEAGSNQISANAQCFVASDVGRTIWIQGARDGAHGPALLKTKITGLISPATVTIDDTADITLTRTEFSQAVMEIYSAKSGGVTAGTNDVKIHNLHIENFGGVGLVTQNTVFCDITGSKIHGEVTPINTRATVGMAWFDDHAGELDMELDGMSMGQARLHLCNFNDAMQISSLKTRLNFNEKVFELGAMTDPGGAIHVEFINTYRPTGTGNPYELVKDDDPADTRITFSTVNMLGDATKIRFYKGRKTYFTVDGEQHTQSPDGTWYKYVVANGGVQTLVAV